MGTTLHLTTGNPEFGECPRCGKPFPVCECTPEQLEAFHRQQAPADTIDAESSGSQSSGPEALLMDRAAALQKWFLEILIPIRWVILITSNKSSAIPITGRTRFRRPSFNTCKDRVRACCPTRFGRTAMFSLPPHASLHFLTQRWRS